jgi:hypothetical protein
MAAPTTTLTATIARSNGKGFQTQEQPGVWLNLSKFAEPAPVVPPVGTACRLTLDAAGFVRAIEPLDQSGPALPPLELEPRDQLPTGAPPSRETTITRLACLKAAAEFLAPREGAKHADVLEVAARFEAWTMRTGCAEGSLS